MNFFEEIYESYKEEYDLNLSEGLIKSTNKGLTINILKRNCPNIKFYYTEDNTFEAIIKNTELKEIEKLLKYSNNLGWFPSLLTVGGKTQKYDDKKVDLRSSFIRFEAKYDEKVENIPKYLYHITPEMYWYKIEHIGLVPKTRSKQSYHPERIFLTKRQEDAEELTSKFYNKESQLPNKFSLLKIDTELIPDYFTLYQDPNYKSKGYYTLNNIPSKAITKIKDIEL